MNQEEIKAPLAAKIAELQSKISNYTITIEESEIAAEKMSAIFNDPTAAAKMYEDKSDEAKQIFEDSRLAGDLSQLGRFERTMTMRLMHCPKKLVITDTNRLSSPAGFHPDDRVFIQTKTAIHCDDIANLPKTNFKLYAHELGNL